LAALLACAEGRDSAVNKLTLIISYRISYRSP